MPLMIDKPADATVGDFVDDFLTQFLADVHSFQEDNFDAGRFNWDGEDRSHTFDIAGAKAQILDVMVHGERYLRTWQRLEDAASRMLYFDLIRYRAGGHLHVRLPTNSEAYHRAAATAHAIPRLPSALGLAAPWPVAHFEFSFRGRDLKLDCLGLLAQFVLGQYFFARDGVDIVPRPGDHVIDAGACLGDSSIAFAAAVGEGGRVHAFDFCDAHLKAVRYNADQNPWAPVTLHALGLSDRCQDGRIQYGNQVLPGQSVEAMDNPPLTTLDTLVAQGAVERVDFIKMDIEGSELRALRGAVETLRRFRPRLAISLYHRREDFYTIPEFLDGLGLGYRFFLDHYTIHHEETVLYATAEAT